MRRFLQILTSFILLFATISFAAAAIPGPQRMLMPDWFSLNEISPEIFTDSMDLSERQIAAIRGSEAKMRDFFGTLKASPRYVLCTTMRCEKTFGFDGRTAQTFGWQIIHIPPRAFEEPGLDHILLTHELFHAELMVRWGPTALWDCKFPNWFNEGMASYLSEDHRISLVHDAASKTWIRGSRSFYDWDTLVAARGWKTAYGAAAANIADIDEAIGKVGLRRLVDRTLKGEKFDSVLEEMMAEEGKIRRPAA